MKLLSLYISPAGPNGWSSSKLEFGREITEIFGPNGCGKTPVIQSIAYALGYPVKFRDDIYDHCEAAVLTIGAPGKVFRIRRLIATQFDVQVFSPDGQEKSFYRELDYGRYLLEAFGFQTKTLISTGNEPTEAYLATLLPIFYLDQDRGYIGAYHAPSNFIRDQYAEMMRLVLGIPAKNSFDQKKLLFEKRSRLDTTDRQIVRSAARIENISREVGSPRRPVEQAATEAAVLREQLTSLRESKDLKGDARQAIESLLYDARASRAATEREIVEAQIRIDGFEAMQAEIEVEINTLSLNEEARRVFSSFQEICSNSSCGLFVGSSESYGKSLLYLRDQVKDLARSSELRKSHQAQLTLNLDSVVLEIRALEAKRDALEAEEGVTGLVRTISELTRKLVDLQKEMHSLEEVESEERDYVALLNEREVLQDEIATLSGAPRSIDLKLLEIRMALRERMIHWLDVLQTKNVSRDISVDSDFGVMFGSEKITQFHGSTLTRIVLAIRTAAYEVYARNRDRKLRFLILDTPRQQDIEIVALGQYIAELKRLSSESSSQVVFSSTEYRYDCLESDREWNPEFEGPEQKMFLKAPR